MAGAALVALLAMPDVTIRTEVRNQPHSGGAVTVNVVHIKGRDQRRESVVTLPNGRRAADFPTQITQCDQGIILTLNSAARIYASMPLVPRVISSSVRMMREPPVPDSWPVVDIFIDHVDTGERRQVGPFTARHVITTTTVTPGPGATTTASAGRRDGWYIDVPAPDCGIYGGRRSARLMVTHPGEHMKITEQGTAASGFPIEETDRTEDGGHSFGTTTRLLQISEATIDPALFRVPAGYSPALQLPWGGVDMTRSDTWRNRAVAYYRYASNWVRQMLR